jgi:hypothetical protein
MRIDESTFEREPKNTPKLGQGLGRIVDLDSDTGLGELVEWAGSYARAGHRLLMVADSHKKIKQRYGCLSGMAKEYGLKLKWRFAREVKVTEVYVHPEWIQSTKTEYQAWVLVTAREIPMTEADKRNALLDTVLRQLDRDERENPGWPSPSSTTPTAG